MIAIKSPQFTLEIVIRFGRPKREGHKYHFFSLLAINYYEFDTRSFWPFKFETPNLLIGWRRTYAALADGNHKRYFRWRFYKWDNIQTTSTTPLTTPSAKSNQST